MTHVARWASQKEGRVQNQKTRACEGFLTIVCVLTRFFIKFPKQIGDLYYIESAEFIHLFCFELEVIQPLMNQLNMNLKFYFKQCHPVKQQFWRTNRRR